MSLFAKDQVEGQPPRALSVLAQFAEGTDVQFFSVVGSPFSLLPMIKSKSFEIVLRFGSYLCLLASGNRQKA